MPWCSAVRPSTALGILTGFLAARRVPSVVRSFHLAFAEHLVEASSGDARPLTLDDYEWIAETTAERGVGDWLFAVEPYRSDRPGADDAFFALLADLPAERIAPLRRMRELVGPFLETCLDEVLSLRPRVVGFTTTFNQNLPSLALARMIKERAPEVAIVFGGSNCEGPMGAALHRTFPWIDFVVRGEGEQVLAGLLDQLLAGEPPTEQPGLCLRRGDQLVHCPEGEPTLAMDAIPAPEYDEYFERLDRSPLAAEVRVKLKIPYESARGCWWGAKHHCTFCGLNGLSMRFRSKSPARVVDDIRRLAERYKVLDFFVVDNIIDMQYFGTVLPELARTGWDLRLFFETKANLRVDQIRELYLAGVTRIQPGIESLSTPILKLMRKGITALQNIRLLKWCAAHGIDVSWNIITGFPGEPEEEYARMAETVRVLGHLTPPHTTTLRIDRFSPYFEDPQALGIRVIGPMAHYQHIYDVDPATLHDLAYFFTAEHLDGRDPGSYTGPLLAAIEQWRSDSPAAYRKLRYRRGPGFIIIDDQRPGVGPHRYKLDDVEAEIYLACDAGAQPSSIRELLGPDAGLSDDDLRAFLDELVACGLIYREGDRYLSLAIPEDPDDFLVGSSAGQGDRRPAPSLLVLP